jgi:hypothetical protein
MKLAGYDLHDLLIKYICTSKNTANIIRNLSDDISKHSHRIK